MRKKLTALAIPALPVGQYPDALTPGLILRVGTRRRTWECRYRQGGKRHAVRLGYFPALGLSEAREAACNLLKRVEAGKPAKPEPMVHPQSPAVLTVGKLIDEYEAMRRREGVRIKRLDDALKVVRDNLADYLSTPVNQFSKADLKAARDVVFNRAPIMANRFMAYTGPILKWAVQEDHIEHNFHGDIRKGKERKRNRVLSDAELKSVWLATFTLDTADVARAYGRLVRFLLLTLQRRDEGASLRYSDIIDGQWRFRTKGDKLHRLKLSKLALDQIGAGEARSYCFAGQRAGKISGFSKLKKELDMASGVAGWRLHDLRRTAGSRIEEMGHDAALVHFLMNHGRQGLSAVYLQSELYERMGTALADWADELHRIVEARAA